MATPSGQMPERGREPPTEARNIWDPCHYDDRSDGGSVLADAGMVLPDGRANLVGGNRPIIVLVNRVGYQQESSSWWLTSSEALKLGF